MSERLDKRMQEIDQVPGPDLWPDARADNSRPRAPTPPATRRILIGLIASLIAAGAFLFVFSAFARDPDTVLPVGDGSSITPTASSTARMLDRVGPYDRLIRMLARQEGAPRGPIYVRTDICEDAAKPVSMSGRGCNDAFSEAEQEAIAGGLSELGAVTFVASLHDPQIKSDGASLRNTVFVWVGPLEPDGDTYRVGGGMWCGCGARGGTYTLSPDGEGWKVGGGFTWIS